MWESGERVGICWGRGCGEVDGEFEWSWGLILGDFRWILEGLFCSQ